MLTYIGIYHSLPALSDAPCYSACIAVRASLWLTRRHRHNESKSPTEHGEIKSIGVFGNSPTAHVLPTTKEGA